MYWADERAAIESRVSANFTAAPVQYPGVPFNAPKTGSWVRLHILPGVTKRVSLGPGGSTRVLGVITFQIFSPVNKGSQAARVLADTLGALFNEAQFSSGSSGVITCWQPAADDRGPTADGTWYQVNVSISFYRDVVVA